MAQRSWWYNEDLNVVLYAFGDRGNTKSVFAYRENDPRKPQVYEFVPVNEDEASDLHIRKDAEIVINEDEE